MSRFIPLLCAVIAAAQAWAAEDLEALLRTANATSRTNLTAALALCNQARKQFPTSSQPLATRARLLDAAGRYEEARNDLSAALKLDPKGAALWQGRGEVNFKAGHFQESVADFDRVIELAPAQAPHHWQRGISLYYAGRFSDGRKQFELHRTVNPNDVENAAWHFLCAARELGVTNARAAMLPVGPDGRVPMKEIDALYRGTATKEQVLAAAARSRSRDAVFYAHLYLGLFHEALGDAAQAREHIGKAAKDPGALHYMGDVARVHWRRLEAAR